MHEARDSQNALDQIADQRWEDQFAQVTDWITEPTHQLLMQARNEAKRFDHLAVSTEHILLALLRESDSGGALVERQLDLPVVTTTFSARVACSVWWSWASFAR